MTIHAASFHAMRADSAAKNLGGAALIVAALFAQTLPSEAQAPPCLAPAYSNPATEIVTSGGVLRGTINLTENFIAMPQPGATNNCAQRPSQLVRVLQGFQGLVDPPMPPPDQPLSLSPASPGPTLRARVGDIVQLSFINQVNQNNFDEDLDKDQCTEVGQGGATYPKKAGDAVPNCLHASSTSNMHFHGTHTSPKSTADNVYLMIRPLPRDRLGNPTPPAKEITQSFGEFFDRCAGVLRQNPLNQWPAIWDDLPRPYTRVQEDLLQRYQAANPTQALWDDDEKAKKQGVWPQYYIGAYPYCFALPEYKAETWPAPPGTSPRMGQSPGTHWYHAHKHGSTAINVGNGMVGAFIIEGPSYDGALNDFYGRYQVDGQPWNTRNQKVMVLNQLQTVPNRLANTRLPSPDFVVNGLRQPQVTMRPGEVQLWRIVNGSGRSAAFFQAPKGLQWRQIAQDGVQFANQNYVASENRAIYVAPGNRIDLLVKAPNTAPSPGQAPFEVRMQNVMARGSVKPIPVAPNADDLDPSVMLLTVTVTGPAVSPGPMPFIPQAPQQPAFLADVTKAELSTPPSIGTDPMTFDSKKPGRPIQHTINNQQFSAEGNTALVNVPLNVAQEWKIQNTTSTSGPGLIDHPFHIHINPFQITEMFDPNENFVDARTGEPLGVLVPTTNSNHQRVMTTVPVPVYILNQNDSISNRQCLLDAQDQSTWKPCANNGAPQPGTTMSNLVWWDVFAIPSGRSAPTATNPNNVIPGYFKMRSRFVDYQGIYVLHCHILIHEDRGMMFRVNVGDDPSVTILRHH